MHLHIPEANAVQVIEPAHVDSDTGSVIQTMENITNFIQALHALQFPTSAIFSVPDIESHGWEERCADPSPANHHASIENRFRQAQTRTPQTSACKRGCGSADRRSKIAGGCPRRPRVVECLLTLKRCHESERAKAESLRASLPHDQALHAPPGSAGSQPASAAGGLASALRSRRASLPSAESPDINYDQVAQVGPQTSPST